MKRILLLSSLIFLIFTLETFAQDIDFKRRSFITQFIEIYKNAYARQDIEYIENIFSEDALIITEGRVKRLKDSPNTSDKIKVIDKNEYSRMIESKAQYLKRLRIVFKDNVSLTLSLANIKTYRHRDFSEIYGLSFLQYWKSAENSSLLLEDDSPGYIFMMIDFKNGDDCPIIHVRTWQPNANITKENDIYNLYDFLIL